MKIILIILGLSLLAVGCESKEFTQEEYWNQERDVLQAQHQYETNKKIEFKIWCDNNKNNEYAQQMCK